MRVRNAHTSPIDGLAPGAIGEINAANPGAKALLAAGKLVPVEGAPSAGMARAEGQGPTFEEGLAMVAEIERQRTRITEISSENEQLKAKVAELESSGSKTAKELRAELASTKAELAALKAVPLTPGNG